MMRKPVTTLSVKVPLTMLQDIRRLRRGSGNSVSTVTRAALREYLDRIDTLPLSATDPAIAVFITDAGGGP